ncbi:hypothetical protein [Bordetella pertussis]|uniref:hypothetical protein n=1 Tax=Bordetella pertussis TaxID=520 RepID=UPI0005E0F374|nr:TetR family transcriptional regulator [Bordetella pertussis]
MVLGATAGPAQHAPVRGWLCDGADRAALQAVARQAMHAWDALAHPPAAAR